MTEDRNDQRDDDVRIGLAALRARDLSRRRARQLRRRCHAMLQAEPAATRGAWTVKGAWLRRVIVPSLGGAWCLAYLVEIIRSAAAIYGYLGNR